MKIDIHDSQTDLKIPKTAVRRLVKSILEFLDSTPQELSLYFVTTEEISELHAEHFQDPTTTDCITFPIDEDHLGELFVCPATAVTYATKHGIDPYDEVALYIIHAILHCLGYDDLTPIDKRAMRKKEKSCMGLLKKLNIRLSP